MKILFTGGGTGGHLFPLIAIARELKELAQNSIDFVYLGPADQRAETLLVKEGMQIKTTAAGKLRRYFGIRPFLENIRDIFFRIPAGFFQSIFQIYILKPDLIFSAGGYGSLPVALAGFLLRMPVFLYEFDAAPGLANRITAKFASWIFSSFSVKELGYSQKNVVSVGTPIRKELLNGSRDEGKKIFNLTQEKPVILIFGGSQGSRRINNLIISSILPEMLAEFELIHVTGPQNFEEVKNAANLRLGRAMEASPNNRELKKYYHPYPFLEEEISHAYAVCDLVISRAGSSTIFEIAAVGKPSLLIPLPESAQNHQVMNAYAYAKSGASLVIEEPTLTSPLFFLEKVKDILTQPKELERMRIAAQNFSRPGAAKTVAEYILSTQWLAKF